MEFGAELPRLAAQPAAQSRHVVAEVRVVKTLHTDALALDRDFATRSLGLEQEHASGSARDVIAIAALGVDVMGERPADSP